MVTQQDKFVGSTRISPEKFQQVLRARATPEVLAERPAREYYDATRRQGVDPLLVLAMFQHESQMGKAGTARITKSWGNTRQPTFGGVEVVRMTTPEEARSGQFPVFKNWLDGCISTAARLSSPLWYYRERTVGQLFLGDEKNPDKVWAPAGDLNNPNGYLRAVLDFMNMYEEVVNMAQNIYEEVRLIPLGNRNRPSRDLLWGGRPSKITIHNTGNPREGAGADMHMRYVTGPQAGGCRPDQAAWCGTSYHAVADDKKVIKLLPYDEAGGHAGDNIGPGNFDSLGIEICENPDSDFPTACRKAAGWAADRLVEFGLGIEDVVQHGHWCGGATAGADCHWDCPQRLRHADRGVSWELFLTMVRNRLPGCILDPNKPAPPPAPIPIFIPDPSRYFPGEGAVPQGVGIRNGFRAFFERLETEGAGLHLRVLGLPRTNEERVHLFGTERTVQVFERGTLIWLPENQAPWDVVKGFGYDDEEVRRVLRERGLKV